MSDLPRYEVWGRVNKERVLLAEFEVKDFEYGNPISAFAERAIIPIEVVMVYD